jgi:predicted transcriptional regulator
MMQVQEIMTREVVAVPGLATVAEAVQLMKEKKLRTLIVQPRYEHDLYGMLTKTDMEQ